MYVIYEHPLTEHLRLLIRLETIFLEIEKSLQLKENDFATKTLFRLIDLSDLVGGQDVRIELLKDLKKKGSALRSLVHNPDVNLALLESTLETIDRHKNKISAHKEILSTNFERDEFVQTVKRKYKIRGTLYQYELPVLNFWRSQDPNYHREKLEDWIQDFLPICQSVKLIMKLTRTGVAPRPTNAPYGLYHQTLESDPPVDLIRVLLHPSAGVFPEISGNKHKCTIRFFSQTNTVTKPIQSSNIVTFDLALVSL